MYKRKIDSEKFYAQTEATGSTLTLLGSELSESGCNGDVTTSSDHYNPTLRLLQIPRSPCGSLGFHLTRSKWDPYPWVSAVDANAPAKLSGLKTGDCVLEVNDKDVLGLRISDIAKLVKSDANDSVSLLLWSAGCDTKCNPESLCCGPMPSNLERLSACTQTILTIIECPVCLDTIAPPVLQCQNGHILCVKCRILSHTCPVCRQRFYPGRSLIAEQIYNTITDTFNLRHQDKLRERLFGAKYKRSTKDGDQQQHQHQQQQQLNGNSKHPHEVNKFGAHHHQHHTSLSSNKFLAKLLGKACSMDNLSTSSSRPPATLLSMKNATNQTTTGSVAGEDANGNDDTKAANANNDNVDDNFDEQSNPGDLFPSNYRDRPAIASSKHLSVSAYDLSKRDTDGQESIDGYPSMNRLQYIRSKRNSVHSHSPVVLAATTTPPSSPQIGLLKRRPCASLNTSMECVASAIHRDTTNGLHPAPVTQPPIPRIQISSCLGEQSEDVFFLCPLGCGSRFSGSTLQQHVKADHCAPILCYGNSSAELALPLRSPLDSASVLLMCEGRNFWIKLRTPGDGSITASALLEGCEDESSNFIMETRLRNKNPDNHANNNVHTDDDGIFERELITRSIVRSMAVTTWQPPYSSSLSSSSSTSSALLPSRPGTDKSIGMLFNRENIRITFGESIDYHNLLLQIDIKLRIPRNCMDSEKGETSLVVRY